MFVMISSHVTACFRKPQRLHCLASRRSSPHTIRFTNSRTSQFRAGVSAWYREINIIMSVTCAQAGVNVFSRKFKCICSPGLGTVVVLVAPIIRHSIRAHRTANALRNPDLSGAHNRGNVVERSRARGRRGERGGINNIAAQWWS